MRLTLRTMLAYLDDILDPGDAQELGKRIADSEFASGLVHRIRSLTRRLRLGAPKLNGKGMGLDPNTVAEYLDNTLPQDRVPDFEKVCLESDVHLAEVACCHQILTLVLGEPAEIAPALRERMYKIHSPIEESGRPRAAEASEVHAPPENGKGVAKAASSPGEPEVAAPAKATRPTPEVPDYLRAKDPGVRYRPLVISLVLAFLIALVALFAVYGVSESNPIMAVFGRRGTPPAAEQLPEDPAANQPEQNASRPGTEEPRAAPTPGQPERPEASRAKDSQPVPPPSPAAPSATDGSSSAGHQSADTATGPRPEPPAEPVEVANRNGEQQPPAPRPEVADSTAGSDTRPPASGEGLPPAPVPEPPVDSQADMVDVGRFISDREVLALWDPGSASWMRVPSDAPLKSGSHLLALPIYRPQIAIFPDVKVTFAGAGDIQLLPPAGDGVAQLSMLFGRAMVVTIGNASQQLHLDLGGIQGLIRFADMDSALAFEVGRYLPPGADPETDAAATVARLFVTSGQIEWAAHDGSDPLVINAGQFCTLAENQQATIEVAAAWPTWFDARNLKPIDREASDELEQFLDLEKPLVLSLMERVQYRKVEVRSLAARCLGYLDRFDTLVDNLRDESHRSYWKDEIDVMMKCLARGPQTAARLRESLEMKRFDDAETLYRLLWGYSQPQLERGAAAELVAALEHESMDVRVLAKENLERITGGKTHLFRPELDASRQRRSIVDWKDDLQKGLIRYPLPAEPTTN